MPESKIKKEVRKYLREAAFAKLRLQPARVDFCLQQAAAWMVMSRG